MRRLIAILALMLIGNVLSAQVQVSDSLSKNRFQVRINGTIKGNYSKGSCYADANSAGNIAIKFSGNDKLVTAYQSPSLYVINGQTSSNRDSVLNRLHIIMLDFQCSTPVPPVETFSYCMPPTFDLWSPASLDNPDTLTGSVSCGGVCPLVYIDSQYQAHIYNAFSPIVTDETTPFRFCQTVFYTCDQIDACLQDTLYSAGLCAIINYFNIEANGVGYSSIDSALCFGNTNNIPSQTYFLDVVDGDTTTLYQILTTINSDTTIRQDISIPFNETENKVLRTLGCVYTGFAIDTINSTLTISARPSKTSGQTYEASSFKIEKIAFADITAGTISGSTYNPNLGEQSNTFALTTGKNTFKISVEDTDGNIAYSIFQVSKTAL